MEVQVLSPAPPRLSALSSNMQHVRYASAFAMPTRTRALPAHDVLMRVAFAPLLCVDQKQCSDPVER